MIVLSFDINVLESHNQVFICQFLRLFRFWRTVLKAGCFQQ